MKKFLSLTITVVLASTIAVSVKASPQSTAALQRRLAWTEQHIDQLNHRRAYLHRFIRHLRKQTQPAPASTGSSETTSTSMTTSNSSYPTSSDATHISAATAAAAMRSAGFPESVIPYFINTIIPRESGFCPTAVYPGHCGDVSLMVPGGPACSLFQLFTCPGPQAADPYVAARYAYSKYRASGLAPWGG